MRGGIKGLCVCLSLFLLAGCQEPTDVYAKYNLGAAHDVVSASIQAIGGLNDWSKVKHVYATAVVSDFDDSQQVHVEQVHLTMDFWHGEITANGSSAQGQPWTVTWDETGKCKVDGPIGQPSDRLCRTLAIILHRARGPLNMVTGYDHALSGGRVRVEGMNLNRISVQGMGQTKAYYFDPSSSLLRFVTSGSDTPGGKGTVTLYGGDAKAYIKMSNGLSFPRSFRIVHIGENTLVGQTPALEVGFSGVWTD